MHRIRRQTLELELPREAGAHSLQQRAGRVLQEKVLPQLEALFNRIAPADRFVRIDHLEVNIGALPEAGWEQAFIERCLQEILKKVEKSTFALSDDPQESPAAVLRPEARAGEVLVYFLENGMLPWYAKGMALGDLEALLLPVFQGTGPGENRTIRELLRQRPAVVSRLAWQFTPAFSDAVLEKVLRLRPGEVRRLEAVLRPQHRVGGSGGQRLRLYRALLALEEQTGSPLPSEGALSEHPPFVLALETVLSGERAGLKLGSILPDAEKRTRSLPDATGRDAAAESRPHARSLPEADSLLGKARLAGEEGTRQQSRKIGVEPSSVHFSKSASDPLLQGVSVENAGLVLLAPYLPAFLGHLALLENNRFVSESALQHALYLLHFLATGEAFAEEPALLLPKILCGLAPDAPIPPSEGLPEEMRMEANALLEAVVRNWPVLKNTSADGLREAFLQRPGQLLWQEAQERWLVRVERRAHDLLLEQLPWTISMVKLGWMEEMVVVEW